MCWSRLVKFGQDWSSLGKVGQGVHEGFNVVGLGLVAVVMVVVDGWPV